MISRTALVGMFCAALACAQTPPLTGIAHVAFRVADIEASRSFYQKLGFEQFFEFARDGKTTEAFLKINDRQFIELYPGSEGPQPLGLMHVCYESSDLESVRAEYAKRDLNPPTVRKAGAGNMLLVLKDPEQLTIEYTQYMPGSRHTEDRGKHLGPNRVSQQLVSAGFPVKDSAAERAYYVGKLGFEPLGSGQPVTLRIPGDSQQKIQLEPASAKAAISFTVADPARTADELRKRGLNPKSAANTVTVTDPDGVSITFVAEKSR